MEDKQEEHTAGEPQPQYGAGASGKTIRFFSSFEEMNDFDHQQMAALSYEERLAQLNYMLRNLYRSELEINPTLGTKIYFS